MSANAPTAIPKISMLEVSSSLVGEIVMSKPQKSNKEDKKKPAHSPKEKKAIKKSKQDSNKTGGGLLTGK